MLQAHTFDLLLASSLFLSHLPTGRYWQQVYHQPNVLLHIHHNNGTVLLQLALNTTTIPLPPFLFPSRSQHKGRLSDKETLQYIEMARKLDDTLVGRRTLTELEPERLVSLVQAIASLQHKPNQAAVRKLSTALLQPHCAQHLEVSLSLVL